MTPDDNEATELAGRAGRQAKHAGKNAAKAAKAAAEPVVEHAVDGAHDVADKLESVAHRVNPRVLSRISGDTGVGFLALSASLYAGVVAVNKFRSAYAGRNAVII